MPTKWHEKKEKLAREQFEKELQYSADDTTLSIDKVAGEAAMGEGEEKLFEKKLSKEEKKALAKARREAKKKAKKKGGDGDDDDDDNNPDKKVAEALEAAKLVAADLEGADPNADDGIDREKADALAAAGTICTFAQSRKGIDARARDINVKNFLLQHMGHIMLEETEIVLNHGNRYGLIGRNGCGKVSIR